MKLMVNKKNVPDPGSDSGSLVGLLLFPSGATN